MRSMEDRLDQSLQSRHLLTGLVTLFGGAALLLACLGLYGVVSYGVALRLREFAIRTALGAEAQRCPPPRAHSRGTTLACGFGARIDCGVAGGTRVAKPIVWRGQRRCGGADSGLIAVARDRLTGRLVPARRAGRVDPAVTLRSE
ncbi:MAG: hypothetical protein ACREEM_20570 [Blastocatellia bacterium]